jgi:hypothetical protein
MGLPQFLESRDYERLSEDQRAFLDRLALLLITQKPSLVPVERVSARVKIERNAKPYVETRWAVLAKPAQADHEPAPT